MEIQVNKMEDLMTSNLMDIISGSYKFKKNEKKEYFIYKNEWKKIYPKIL